MKSGLALMLELAEAPNRPAVDLTLVFLRPRRRPVLPKTSSVRCWLRIPELSKVDVAVALEPSDNKLQLGCGGSLHATARFRGRTRAQRAPMARRERDPKVRRVPGQARRRSAALEHHRWPRVAQRESALRWPAVVAGRNVIPDVFELNLNHRFAPGTSAEAAQSYVRDLVAGEAELEFTDVSPSAPPFTHATRSCACWQRAESSPSSPNKRGQTSRASPVSVFPRSTSVPALRRKPIRRTSGPSSRCSTSVGTSSAPGSVRSLLAQADHWKSPALLRIRTPAVWRSCTPRTP